MKTWQVITAVVAVVALWLGNAMQHDPGYVLISYRDASLQTSIWFALITMLVGGLALYWGALFVRWLIRSPAAFGRWRSRRREARSTDLTHEGLTRFEEGDHKGALQLLVRGAKFSPSAAVNYLSAARAADAMGDGEQRDGFLRQAEEAGCSPQAVKVASARMASRRSDPRAVIESLAAATFNPDVVRMLVDAHRTLEQWDALEALVPEVKRHSKEELDSVQRSVLLGRLRARGVTLDSARAAWKAAPRPLNQEPESVLAYARALEALEAPDEAEKVLRKVLKVGMDDALLEAYAGLGKADAKTRLKAVQGWLAKEPESPALLRAAGRAAIAGGDHDAGADYLERSLQHEPNAEAERALGELRAFNGDFAKSSEHYRRALGLA